MKRLLVLAALLGAATPSWADLSDSGDLIIGEQGIIAGTMTVKGNAFSVGGSTFSVKEGTATVGGRLDLSAQGIKWADGTTSTTAANTGAALLSSTQTFTGINTFGATRTSCPSGFTEIVSQNRALGCMETDEEGTAAFNTANEDCWDSYGGYVPPSHIWQIAMENYALSNETDDTEWVAQSDVVITEGDHGYIYAPHGLYKSNNVEYTFSMSYRCFIAK